MLNAHAVSSDHSCALRVIEIFYVLGLVLKLYTPLVFWETIALMNKQRGQSSSLPKGKKEPAHFKSQSQMYYIAKNKDLALLFQYFQDFKECVLWASLTWLAMPLGVWISIQMQ